MGDVPAALLRPFDLASPVYCSSGSSCSAARIVERRAAAGGELFFDRLLAFAGIDGPSMYPPTSPSALRRLLSAIHEAGIDRLKRDCFVYYLARDADATAADAEPAAAPNGDMEVDAASTSSAASGSGGPSRAATFARSRCLPRTWRTYMDGYWYLDHGRWDSAVACLRDPCLPDVDFVRDVVSVLTTQVSPPSHALALAHAFLQPRAAVGKLGSQEEADADLLGTTSVAGMAAAFDTIRALGAEAERKDAREAVWCWALGAPRSPAGKGAHTAQPRALRQLLHLVLSDEEHEHLVELLAHPPRDIGAPARSLLHDLVTLRLVHAGKYEETLALDRELAGTDTASAADRQRRREMVREFIDILPAAQRRILLGDRLTNGEAEDVDVDMSGSWVDVQKEADAEKAKQAATAKAQQQEKQAITAAPATPAPALTAPTPIRAPAFRNIQATSTPTRAGASSPFGGPPRFPASPAILSPRPPGSRTSSPPRQPVALATPARSAPTSPELSAQLALPATPGAGPSGTTPTVPASALPAALRPSSPPRAVAAASPFRPPASASKPAARKPKRVIDDMPTRRSSRRVVDHSADEDADGDALIRAPSEPPIPEDHVAAPVSVPASAPAPTPATTRRLRRAAASRAEPATEESDPTPTKRTTRGGRASRASTVEPDHGGDADDLPIPGSFVAERPPVSTRSTRNAAKAALDDPEPAPEMKRAKPRVASATTRRTTRAMSEATDDGAPVSAASSGPARRTRRAAAAASERGSPTPSVASSVASPPAASTRRTRTARETSATPRATRARKAKAKE